MHNIESVVGERRNSAQDSQERHPVPLEECLITYRTELSDTLSILDVRVCRFAAPTFLNYLRGAWGWVVLMRSVTLNNTC